MRQRNKLIPFTGTSTLYPVKMVVTNLVTTKMKKQGNGLRMKLE